MTQPVLARRFINTPTVEALYNAENPESVVEASDDKIDDLSDEYNKVSGTESLYYQYVFSHIPRQHDLNRAGNEGFVSWIGDMVNALITAVKNFFKWVFSFFTGKKEVAARQNKDLLAQLDKSGVRKHFTHYPNGYMTLWASKAKVPNNLDWVLKSVDDLEKAAAKVKAYVKEVGDVVEKAEAAFVGKQLSTAKEKFDKLFKDHHANLVKIFGGDPAAFVGGTTVSVNAHGKVVMKVDPDLLEAEKNAGYLPNETKTREIAKALDGTNKVFADVINDAVKLENVFVKNLQGSLAFAKSTELENEAVAKSMASDLNELIRNGMAGIKILETLIFKVYQSVYLIAKSSIETKG
jgi:hypothetical protein